MIDYRENPEAERAGNFAFVCGILFVLFAAVVLMRGFDYSITKDSTVTDVKNVPCQEDEVVAVWEDHNPNHGLSWGCVNMTEFVHEYLNEDPNHQD